MSESENLHAGHRERTVSKFLEYPDSFKEHELLELLLFYAIPRKDTNPLAHKLLRTFGSIRNVLSAQAKDLKTVQGVGDSTAGFIVLMGKLIKIFGEKKERKKGLTAPEKIYAVIRDFFEDKTSETFLMIMLDKRYNVIAELEFTDDNKDSVTADIPEISGAFAVHRPKHAIIAHNHLSNIAMYSEADDLATKKIGLICNIYDVKLDDHIIYAGGDLYSYHSHYRMDHVREQADINLLMDQLKENHNANK